MGINELLLSSYCYTSFHYISELSYIPLCFSFPFFFSFCLMRFFLSEIALLCFIPQKKVILEILIGNGTGNDHVWLYYSFGESSFWDRKNFS